ncbi:MAG: hypothetical protein ACLQUY_06860 [Ktedonobacterales bacterium]
MPVVDKKATTTDGYRLPSLKVGFYYRSPKLTEVWTGHAQRLVPASRPPVSRAAQTSRRAFRLSGELPAVRSRLGGPAFAAAWAEGQTMTLAQVLAEAENAVGCRKMGYTPE